MVADHLARHGLADGLGVFFHLLPRARGAFQPERLHQREVVEELLPFQAVAQVVRRHHVVVEVDAVEHLEEDFGIVIALHGTGTFLMNSGVMLFIDLREFAASV